MKSTVKKILAVALMAAMIACVGAGCAKNDTTKAESSTTSAASADASTESKAEESKEESKKEESKAEESSKVEESKEEPSAQPAVDAAELVGVYVVGAGSEVQTALELKEGNTVVVTKADGSMEGTWAVEGTTVTVTMADGDVLSFNYADGTLTSTTDAAIVFVKQTGEQTEEPSETKQPGAYDAIIGTYTLTVDDAVVAAVRLARIIPCLLHRWRAGYAVVVGNAYR